MAVAALCADANGLSNAKRCATPTAKLRAAMLLKQSAKIPWSWLAATGRFFLPE